MRRQPITSRTIASLGYETELQELEIEFRENGHVYRYFKVPAEEHEAFLAADSKGTYLNQVFKIRNYPYVRVA